jgi:hypothetical protein
MIGILVCAALILFLQFITSFWWWTMLIPFLYGLLLSKSAWEGFRTGAASAGLTWLGMSVHVYFTGSKIIASRVGAMFGLNASLVMILVTVLVAAVSGGMAGLAGSMLKKAFIPK